MCQMDQKLDNVLDLLQIVMKQVVTDPTEQKNWSQQSQEAEDIADKV